MPPRTDPSSSRATRLARLIILTVALPSLLLTVLGAIAVANEEIAAHNRLKTLYQPIGSDMAKHFNAWVDETVESDEPYLAELAAWAAEGALPSALPSSLEGYLAKARHAVNFFVVADGVVMLPTRLETGSEALYEALKSATDWSGRANCRPIEKLLREGLKSEEEMCAGRLAAALCRNDGLSWSAARSAPCCGRHWSSPLLKRVREILRLANDERERAAALAMSVAQRLNRPDADEPPWLTTLVARRLASVFKDDIAEATLRARHVLQTIATRSELVRYVARRNRVYYQEEGSSSAVPVGDWRRVVVTRTYNGLFVGYELVPELVADELQPVMDDKRLSGTVSLGLYPVFAPDWWWGPHLEEKAKEHAVVWYAFMKKTDLAWGMGLTLDEENDFWSVSYSRSRLYLWSLVLIAAAMIFGIAHAIYAIGREGRLSRLKTDFVSSVSHDLRTPLTSIRMFTESLLMDRVRGEAQRREYLEVIARETERLSRLTERILDFSRMEAGRKAYAYGEEEVAPLVEHALQSCTPMIECSNGKVSVDLPQDLPKIYGDRDALIEVLINLISNALKYSEGAPQIRVWARRSGPWLEVGVSDQGIGVSAADQKRIFDKFHRVDCRRTSEVGGCGIGLSLVKHIVEAHHGTIDVESTLGEGSTFVFRLPINHPSHCDQAGSISPPV